MLSYETEEPTNNLEAWEVTSASATEININLSFKKPLEVSQGDKPDILLVQLDLSHFPDENDRHLPKGLLKEANLPAMISS